MNKNLAKNMITENNSNYHSFLRNFHSRFREDIRDTDSDTRLSDREKYY